MHALLSPIPMPHPALRKRLLPCCHLVRQHPKPQTPQEAGVADLVIPAFFLGRVIWRASSDTATEAEVAAAQLEADQAAADLFGLSVEDYRESK